MYPSWQKERSRLGKWLDLHGRSQEWLAEVTGISNNSISDLCSGVTSNPRSATRAKIIKALSQIDPDVSASDFW
ncbi:helix-turn-helix domain-containing protein [Paenibacillus kobensis]|uniref:helix-turn-helix domain-containing protein n=1 Tax=Paenibacillus kobensis TaxID=59841 RepID=UPI0013E400B3